jgi:hypothetical protein
MSRLISRLRRRRTVETNIKADQLIHKNKVPFVDAEDEYSWIFEQLYEREEFPRYQMLYDYFTSSYSTAL